MAQRIEKWLDRREEVRDGEVAFSEAARERIYSHARVKKIFVPAGEIRATDETERGADGSLETIYAVQGSDVARGSDGGLLLAESQVADSVVQQIDTRLLGPPGHLFDDVFNEVRTPEAAKRYDRIHLKASRIRTVAATLGTVAAAFAFTVIGHETGFITEKDAKACDQQLEAHQYIEKQQTPPAQLSDAATCTLNGINYVIRNHPAASAPKTH